jgi:hypothetical protein
MPLINPDRTFVLCAEIMLIVAFCPWAAPE